MRLPVRDYWRLLSRYLTDRRRLLATFALIVFAELALRLATPWFAARFLNEVTSTSHAQLGVLLVLAAQYCVAGIVDQLLTVAGVQLGSYVSWLATNDLRTDVVRHCLALDLDFHHGQSPGDLVERIDGDACELANFFARFAVNLAANLLLIAAALVIICAVDWRAGLGFCGFVVLAGVFISRMRGAAAPHWQRARQASADLYGNVEEWLGGLPDIRANGATEHIQRCFAKSQRATFTTRRAAILASGVVRVSSGIAMEVGSIVVLAAAAGLYLSGAMSLGTVFVLSTYTRMITGPLGAIIHEFDDLHRSTAAIGRMRELLSITPTIISGRGVAWPDSAPDVVFEDVSFRYGAGPYVLQNVSIHLPAGKIAGIVGRTGAGKSTLVRLLLRLYDPESGRILLDGTDLRDATLAQVRDRIGVVGQEVQIFHATVRDNLTLFTSGRADDELVTVLRQIGLSRWLARQPNGLDTVLSAGGGMSAGEAQLLGAARVFVTDPGLVILDEPTSRLDPHTERSLELAFDRLFAGRTGLIVAHRTEILRRADLIVTVVDGTAEVRVGGAAC